jgi:CRISPR/Cas system-associated endoribonuclease Cas2
MAQLQLSLLAYDITLDRARTQLAHLLEAAGWARLQRSIFLGEARPSEIRTLWQQIEALEAEALEIMAQMDPAALPAAPEFSVLMFPLSPGSLQRHRSLGRPLHADALLWRQPVLVL